MLPPLVAHGACLVLVSADLAARAFRIRWYLRGLGAQLTPADAFVATAWGDAAAGLTPLRFGGEAAKFAGLMRAGVRPPLAVLALGLEALITYPLVAAFGAGLAWCFAPQWWQTAGPALARGLTAGWPWLLGAGAALVACAWLGLRWRRAIGPVPDSGAGVREMVRRVPAGPLWAGIVCSLYNVVARTLVLPLLACTLPGHPPLGVLLLGSFALLYSQLLLPTPAGVGAVEFGFFTGVAGDLGAGGGSLLLAWRFYTVGLGALIGAALAIRVVGWAALRRVFAPARPSDS
jgi:hypothetical protein